MNLGKFSKVLVLVATVIPPLYFVLFFVMFFSFAVAKTGPPMFAHFGLFFGLHLGVMLLICALLVFYMVFLFKTDRVKAEMKALWAIVLFMGSPISMPIFWFLYIWRSSSSHQLAAND